MRKHIPADELTRQASDRTANNAFNVWTGFYFILDGLLEKAQRRKLTSREVSMLDAAAARIDDLMRVMVTPWRGGDPGGLMV